MRTTFRHSSLLLSTTLALILLPALWSQIGPLLTVTPPGKAAAARNAGFEAKLAVHVRSGYHVNSNKPNEDYLIPLRLTWEASPLAVRDVQYPKPQMVTFPFSNKPLAVYTGDFVVATRFQAPAGAPLGTTTVTGKLFYQACNDNTCFPPKTVEVRLPVEIRAQ